MRQTDERGIALPAVIAVTTLLFTLVTFVAALAVRSHEAGRLYEERMRVKYAAETGIAKMQQEWALGQRKQDTLLDVGGVTVYVQVEEKPDNALHVVATGYGEKGVQQTISALIDQKTLAIINWIGYHGNKKTEAPMEHSKRHLVLIGMMGTGKTTIGQAIAAQVPLPWKDTDQALVAKWGCSIADFFALYGEERFREEETQMLEACLAEPSLLVTTGGGIVLREQNRQLLAERAFVVHLDAEPEEIIRRLTQTNEERPLLKGDLRQRVYDIYEARRELYRFADVRVDTTGKSIDEMATAIVRAWQDHV